MLRGVGQWLSRLIWDQEIVGSSPTSPTILEESEMTWIDEYLDLAETVREERAVKKIARLIYPTPFGDFTLPDERGYRYPKGQLRTAGDYARVVWKITRPL